MLMFGQFSILSSIAFGWYMTKGFFTFMQQMPKTFRAICVE